MVKNPPANAGYARSIPGLGRYPGEGNGNPLQYSCLENPTDRGDCRLHSTRFKWVGHDLVIKQQQTVTFNRRERFFCALPFQAELLPALLLEYNSTAKQGWPGVKSYVRIHSEVCLNSLTTWFSILFLSSFLLFSLPLFLFSFFPYYLPFFFKAGSLSFKGSSKRNPNTGHR